MHVAEVKDSLRSDVLWMRLKTRGGIRSSPAGKGALRPGKVGERIPRSALHRSIRRRRMEAALVERLEAAVARLEAVALGASLSWSAIPCGLDALDPPLRGLRRGHRGGRRAAHGRGGEDRREGAVAAGDRRRKQPPHPFAHPWEALGGRERGSSLSRKAIHRGWSGSAGEAALVGVLPSPSSSGGRQASHPWEDLGGNARYGLKGAGGGVGGCAGGDSREGVAETPISLNVGLLTGDRKAMRGALHYFSHPWAELGGGARLREGEFAERSLVSVNTKGPAVAGSGLGGGEGIETATLSISKGHAVGGVVSATSSPPIGGGRPCFFGHPWEALNGGTLKGQAVGVQATLAPGYLGRNPGGGDAGKKDRGTEQVSAGCGFAVDPSAWCRAQSEENHQGLPNTEVCMTQSQPHWSNSDPDCCSKSVNPLRVSDLVDDQSLDRGFFSFGDVLEKEIRNRGKFAFSKSKFPNPKTVSLIKELMNGFGEGQQATSPRWEKQGRNSEGLKSGDGASEKLCDGVTKEVSENRDNFAYPFGTCIDDVYQPQSWSNKEGDWFWVPKDTALLSIEHNLGFKATAAEVMQFRPWSRRVIKTQPKRVDGRSFAAAIKQKTMGHGEYYEQDLLRAECREEDNVGVPRDSHSLTQQSGTAGRVSDQLDKIEVRDLSQEQGGEETNTETTMKEKTLEGEEINKVTKEVEQTVRRDVMNSNQGIIFNMNEELDQGDNDGEIYKALHNNQEHADPKGIGNNSGTAARSVKFQPPVAQRKSLRVANANIRSKEQATRLKTRGMILQVLTNLLLLVYTLLIN